MPDIVGTVPARTVASDRPAPPRIPDAPPVVAWSDDSWRSCVRCPLGRCNVRDLGDGTLACVPVPGTALLRLYDGPGG